MTSSPTPASLGFRMPAARRAWAEVANTIVRYEPVTLVVNTGESEDARRYVAPEVELVERPLNDAWMRDIGPSFLLGENGELAAADWVFNGWGAQSWARWDKDQDIAEHLTDLTGVRRFASRLINEGGGIHVDGEGTVLVTDTVQLGEGRNADWTREQVEAELHAHLGTTKAIWLPRGLTRDYDEFGTRGHIDIVAAFGGPGTILLHRQDDPAHPDHAVSVELKAVLAGKLDAQGRPLRIIDVPAPTTLRDEEGWVDWSYINHYVANDVVVLCAFDDPNDAIAAGILERTYPGR